jgi:WD40 repeat protein
MLTASDENTVLLIDMASGVQVASMHGGPAVFTADGAAIVVAYRGGLVRRTLPGLPVAGEYPAPVPWERPPELTLTPTGERIIATSSLLSPNRDVESVHIWDLQTGAYRCGSPGGLGTVALAAEGDLAWGCRGTALVEWSLQDCTIQRSWPIGGCYKVAVSRNGTRVAVGYGQLRVFDAVAQTWIPHHVSPRDVDYMHRLANGELLLIGDGLRTIDPTAPTPATRRRFTLLDKDFGVGDLTISADNTVAAAFAVPRRDGAPKGARVRAWSVDGWQLRMTSPGAPLMVEPQVIAPHGETYIGGPPGTDAGLYRVDTGERLATYPFVEPAALRFSPDGSRCFYFERKSLFILDGRTGALLREIGGLPWMDRLDPGSLVISPRAEHVFLDDGYGRHTLVDLHDGSSILLREPLPAAGDTGEGLGFEAAFSPDGATLLTRLSVWDVRTKRRLRRLGGPGTQFGPKPFSADGRRIALKHEDAVLVVDAARGRMIRRFPGWTRPALSADGRQLLAIDGSHRPALLDVDSGERLRDLPVTDALEVSFDATGNLAVASERALSTWSATTGEHLSSYPIPHGVGHVTLPTGRRLVADGQALALLDASGGRRASFAATRDGRGSVAWAPDGAWDGDADLLAFSESLVPCTGTPGRRADLWRAELRSP